MLSEESLDFIVPVDGEGTPKTDQEQIESVNAFYDLWNETCTPYAKSFEVIPGNDGEIDFHELTVRVSYEDGSYLYIVFMYASPGVSDQRIMVSEFDNEGRSAVTYTYMLHEYEGVTRSDRLQNTRSDVHFSMVALLRMIQQIRAIAEKAQTTDDKGLIGEVQETFDEIENNQENALLEKDMKLNHQPVSKEEIDTLSSTLLRAIPWKQGDPAPQVTSLPPWPKLKYLANKFYNPDEEARQEP